MNRVFDFKYIIGANIELFCKAKYYPAEDDINAPDEVELLEVRDKQGLEVETGDIAIAGESLDILLDFAAMEAWSEIPSAEEGLE